MKKLSFNVGLKPTIIPFIGILSFLLVVVENLNGATITVSSSTNWSALTGGSEPGGLPNTSDAVIVRNGATLTVNSSTATCGSLQLGGTSTGTSGAGTLTFSGATPTLTVSGTVQLGGYGNTNRTGTITFTSGSTIDAGSVILGNPNTSSRAAGTITMTAGGTLRTGSIAVNTVTGNSWSPGVGTVILDATNTLPATIVTSFNNLSCTGGTTTLAAATSMTGVLTVKAGATLALSTFALGSPTSIALECGTPTGSSITAGTGGLSLGGDVTVTDVGTGTSGATVSCPVALGANRIFNIADDGTSATDLTMSGVISGGFGITKSGAGTLALSAANTYTGAVTINAGILNANNLQNANTASSLGTGASTSAITIAGAGTLQYTGSGHSTSRAIILSGTGATIDASGSGTMTLNGGVTGNTFGLSLTGSGNGNESGIIGTTTGTVTKTGTGTWTLSGTNTYTGATTINSGVLSAGTINNGGTAGNLGAATNVAANLVLGGGTLQYTGSTASTDRAFTLTAGTNSSIDVTTNNLTISGASASTNGSLTKIGNGILTFTGANAYTGTTTITTGELRLNPAANITPNSQFILNGGTLGTTGITSGRTITNSSTLQLAANSIINLEANTHTLKFANSSGSTWAGTGLTINGWTGTVASSGTAGRIFVGTNSSGLTATQLAAINFTGFDPGAQILTTGEIVPAIPPTTVEVYIGGVKKGGYNTLKAAFDKINDGTHQGAIIIRINGSTTETATAALNASGGIVSYTSVTIYPTTSGLSIAGALNTTPLIQLNGADNVTIDGRVNNQGDADLIINNTSTASGARTIEFINSAQTNTVKYCVIKGAGTSTNQGTINFSTAGAGTGNDGNTIQYCNITGVSAANSAVNAIYSLGSATNTNSGNTISNNNIYDFLLNGTASNGISISSNSTAFTISGNSFYETTSFAPTAAVEYAAIRIDNASGNDFTISGNYIGGSGALCSGTAWTKTNAFNNIFNAIYLNCGTGTNNVQGNTIQNFSYSNSGSAYWYGIYIAGTSVVNVGTFTGNTIGSATGTGSITFTGGADGAAFNGIYIASTGAVTCSNNSIGSVTTDASSAANACHFYGIYKTATAGNIAISNNNIGSISTANSINTRSTATGNPQRLFAIYSKGTTGTTSISTNIVKNLNNSSTNTTTYSRIRGIYTISGTGAVTISDNQISYLKTAGNGTPSVNRDSTSMIGISLDAGGAGNIISGNTINNLETTLLSKTEMYGIYYEGTGSGTDSISRNFIHTLIIPSNGSATSFIQGMMLYTGNYIVSNNIINLGGNIPLGCNMSGLWIGAASGTTNTVKIYYNTVYLSGTATPSTGLTYAFRAKYPTTPTLNIRNNVFCNLRTNSPAANTHSVISVSSTTNLTINYNDYFFSQIFGNINDATTYNTFANWKTNVGQDANSLNTDPQFITAGSTIATDYRVKASLPGVIGTGILTDYGSLTRPTSGNTTMGAWENGINKWKGTTSTDWNTASNWTVGVPATDATIVFDAAPVNNCVMDQNRSVTDIINGQSTYKLMTNGKTLTVKGDLLFSNGAQIDATSASSTIVFSGSTAQSIPANSFVNNEIYNLSINNANNVKLNGTLNLMNTITATAGCYLDATTNSPNVTYGGSAVQSLDSLRFLSNKIHYLTIDNAAGVTLNGDITVDSLTINSGKLLTISTSRQMTAGIVTNNAGVSGLVIKSSPSAPNGSFIFNNLYGNPVLATVEMYTKAAATVTSPSYSQYKWQYFGIPLRSIVPNPTFEGSWIRIFNQAVNYPGQWKYETNDSTLYSFRGYEITQPVAKTIYLSGQLENKDNLNIRLPYTAGATYAGQVLLSNPYTAAIDIKKLVFGTQTDLTVYLYNCGSYSDWTATNGGTLDGNNPGQYTSVPQNVAGNIGIPRQIPSMQGFLVKATSNSANATISIPYSSVMKNSTQQRVQSKSGSSDNSDLPGTLIDVKGSRFSDRMWLFTQPDCTHAFDNGWDGMKNFSPSVYVPQLFIREPSGDYQINTVDNINNTQIGFYAGEDSIYTLTFTHVNTAETYPSIYLVDQQKGNTVDITNSGTTYTFITHLTDTLVNRFKVVLSPGVTTSTSNAVNNELKVFSSNRLIIVDNPENHVGDLTLYDVSGKAVYKQSFKAAGITTLATNLPTGAYVAKAIIGAKTSAVSRFIFK